MSRKQQTKVENTELEESSVKQNEKMETQVKIINQSVARVAAAAESFGVLQIECKIKNSINAIMKHISENLRFNFEKSKRELEELRNLLKECQLLEDTVEEEDVRKHRAISTTAVILNNSLESFLENEETAISNKEQSTNCNFQENIQDIKEENEEMPQDLIKNEFNENEKETCMNPHDGKPHSFEGFFPVRLYLIAFFLLLGFSGLVYFQNIYI